MAKVTQGRISGFHGMESHTADELFSWASTLEQQIKNPANKDDPKWLQRRADRLRKLAQHKQKAIEHKLNADRGK